MPFRRGSASQSWWAIRLNQVRMSFASRIGSTRSYPVCSIVTQVYVDPHDDPRVLDRAELPVDTAQLARFLIGKMLVRRLAEGVAGGRIVETEAYGIGDPAGHAYRGITPRNRALFLERGHAYVYLAYGVSFMLNVSSETPAWARAS
jgi:hypothetical protein